MTAKKPKQVALREVGRASANRIRISPQKARLIVNLIRGKGVEDAMNTLKFLPKKGARIAEKLLQSAIMNAKEANGADVDRLWVAKITVDAGPTMKRFMPRAQGRATPIRKRSAHITVVLGEK